MSAHGVAPCFDAGVELHAQNQSVHPHRGLQRDGRQAHLDGFCVNNAAHARTVSRSLCSRGQRVRTVASVSAGHRCSSCCADKVGSGPRRQVVASPRSGLPLIRYSAPCCSYERTRHAMDRYTGNASTPSSSRALAPPAAAAARPRRSRVETFEPPNAHDRLQRMHALKQFYEHSDRMPAKPRSKHDLDVLKERHQCAPPPPSESPSGPC